MKTKRLKTITANNHEEAKGAMYQQRYPGELRDVRENGSVPCDVAVCREITGPHNPDVQHREAADALWTCEEHRQAQEARGERQ